MAGSSKIQLYKRMLDAQTRALPYFLVVGVQKAGTTTLFHYLVKHPQILPPLKKEVQYFDKNYNKSMRWYRAHFPKKKALHPNGITGEASTDYSFHPHAPQRINKHLGNPKLILMLRDPARRAISHYHHYVRNRREHLPIEQALHAEQERLRNYYPGKREKMNGKDNDSRNYIRYAYKKKGLYLEQIQHLHKIFGKDSLFVGAVEELKTQPYDFFKRLHRFLAIDEHFFPENLTKQNPGNYKDHYPGILNELKHYYKEPNQRLFEYIGKEFPW